jgi:putative GTP pyrophosphokinase
VRLVCTFPESVYLVSRELGKRFDVVEIKDYIRTPKPNGYRSLHIILRFPPNAARRREILAEVQLRTIAMDCWASLEHQLKYKHTVENQELIVAELRRCADELASADLMMQTINEMIRRGGETEQ